MTYLAPVLAAALLVGLANSLKCYSCSLSLNRAACGTVANCSSGSSCMKVVKKSTSYYRYTAPLDPPTPSSGDPPAGQEEEAPPIMNHSVVAGRDGTWKTEKSVALGRQEEDTAQPSRHRAAANRRRRAPQEGGRAGLVFAGHLEALVFAGRLEGLVFSGHLEGLVFAGRLEGLVFAGRLEGLVFARRLEGLVFAGHLEGLVFAGRLEGLVFAGRLEGLVFAGHLEALVFAGHLEALVFAGRLEGLVFSGHLVTAGAEGRNGRRLPCGVLPRVFGFILA
ncbi:hypothetical protein NDU88_005103 [Pleurodeles waltl]|uniref:Uncharacterized protein n=1 Tax=Pleurodeles waltl TaxID=8319 RepID=A0AAV7V337_PLEWA|nr:hypothetical protein NDU88_005103 [Pleurodeles waltl]